MLYIKYLLYSIWTIIFKNLTKNSIILNLAIIRISHFKNFF